MRVKPQAAKYAIVIISTFVATVVFMNITSSPPPSSAPPSPTCRPVKFIAAASKLARRKAANLRFTECHPGVFILKGPGRANCTVLVDSVTTKDDKRRRPLSNYNTDDLEECAAGNVKAMAEIRSAVSLYSTVHGFDIACYARNDVVCRDLGEFGYWESAIFEKLLRGVDMVKDATGKPVTYLDIGGNVGTLAFAMANQGVQTEVFEMMPRNVALLHLTHCLNPQFPIVIRPGGLSDKRMTCAMVSQATNVGDANIECDKANLDSSLSRGYVHRGDVSMRRLSDIYPPGAFPYPSVIKIDVEGHELNVIRGALAVLKDTSRQPHMILCEVWKLRNVVALVEIMFDAGYKCEVIVPEGQKERFLESLADVEDFHATMNYIENLVFTRQTF
eukprot:PhM_4_TR2748/c1_g1_i2/m.86192